MRTGAKESIMATSLGPENERELEEELEGRMDWR